MDVPSAMAEATPHAGMPGVFSDDDRLDCPEGLLLLPGGDVLVASCPSS